MPHAGGRVLGGDVAELLEGWSPDVVVLENVNAFRGSSAQSAFAFGRAFGVVEGAAESLWLRVETVSPARWKAAMGLGRDKGASRALACRLWPDRRDDFKRAKDDGRAEAALLAEAWCRIGKRRGLPTDASVQHSAT